MTITPDPRPVLEDSAARILTRVFAVLALGAAGMAALLALLPAAGHDQIWFLMMARRWLGGAQLYGPEIFDSNPPGVVWLSAVAVGVGNLLHLPATTAGKMLVALAETAASWLAVGFLRRSWRPERRYESFALLFAAIVVFYVVPARDFGQRDFMLGFLILPYVVASATPPAWTKWQDWLAGMAAGVGICLKPHYALIPIAIELLLLLSPPRHQPRIWQSRVRYLLRPEPVLILLTGGVFLAAVRHFAPVYFTAALPVTRDVYWAIGHLSIPQLVWEAMELCVLGAVATTLYLATASRSPAVRSLLVAAAAATAAYFLQGTGWYYQQLPAIALFGVALALQLLDILAGKTRKMLRWLLPATASLTLLALALATHFTGYPFTRDRSFAIETPDPLIFAGLPPGTPVATLTTSVDEAMMPVERYGLTWAQRTNNLWLLPAILREEERRSIEPDKVQRGRITPVRLAELDALQHRWMVEDLRRWKPTLVLVERCQKPGVVCQELEDRDDNLLAWFLRDASFATLWRNYSFAETRGRFDVYQLSEAAGPPGSDR